MAFLVIEVGDSTVVADRDETVPQYAAAGVPEAWITDLPANAFSLAAVRA